MPTTMLQVFHPPMPVDAREALRILALSVGQKRPIARSDKRLAPVKTAPDYKVERRWM